MISPRSIKAATLADATSGLSLVLPRSRYERTALVVRDDEGARVVFLDEDDRFISFDCNDNRHHPGLLIEGVSIELDPSSVFNPTNSYVLGCLVREGEQLTIMASAQERYMGSLRVPLLLNLPACADNEKAAFARWQIVIGEGDRKQILKAFDLTTPDQAR